MAARIGTASVMTRKLALARSGDRDGGRSALRALRLALMRSAADELDLTLAVIGATQARSGPEKLAARLGDDRLFLLLDGPDDRVGGAALDRTFVSALIRQQTTGNPNGGDAADRTYTATDAALTAPLVDAMLSRAPALTDAGADRDCLGGYRFGVRVEDGRSLGLALEAEKFRVFDLTVDIESGVAQGAMCLILPDADVAAPGEDAAIRGPGLEQAFGVLRADLSAVIGRVRVPFARLAEMQPGDLLTLVEGRIDRTEVVTLTGRSIAVGRLGQSGGLRAVRLNETPPSIAEGAGTVPAFEERKPRAVPPDGGSEKSRPASDPVFEDDAGAEDYEEHLMKLTPQQAAVEISALAGLPPPEPRKPARTGGAGLLVSDPGD